MCEISNCTLMESLWHVGAMVQANEPEAMLDDKQIYWLRYDLSQMATRDQAGKGANSLEISTEWKIFCAVDFGWPKQQLTAPVIICERNPLEPAADVADVKAAGLLYYPVCRDYVIQEYV
ncbi:hypothetical protein [Vreelandella sulfidaeris]|uniref:Uncharacterized protein n=1 Tax=Vreelandella sulfidaeris TaxID=115553 RepID=A0A455U415_9GAMM|nr:hypothetical protein HSBAA_19310 [Halomonas sulfidaeris]